MVHFRAQKVTKAWRRFRSDTKRLRRRRSGHGNGHGGGARARLCGGNAMAGKVDVQPGEPVSQGTLPGLSTACIVVAVFLGAGGGM